MPSRRLTRGTWGPSDEEGRRRYGSIPAETRPVLDEACGRLAGYPGVSIGHVSGHLLMPNTHILDVALGQEVKHFQDAGPDGPHAQADPGSLQ